MKRTRRLASFCLFVLLLVASSSPAGAGRRRPFGGRREFLPYTRGLPGVDRVELLKLKLDNERWTGDIEAARTLRGEEARRVAALWRAQTYTLTLAACHNPAYAVKFYSGERLLAYASVCWACNNILLLQPKLEMTQGFLGDNPAGRRLSRVFESAFEPKVKNQE